jgi:hypothetical protein
MAVYKERTNANGITATYWRLARVEFNAQEDQAKQIRVLWAGYANEDFRKNRKAQPIDHCWETFPMGDALAELYPRIQGMSPEFAGAPILEDDKYLSNEVTPEEPETQGVEEP